MASEMQLVGAGLAAIGTGAAAIGVGLIFGNFVNGALRNPSAAASQFTNAIIGAALADAEAALWREYPQYMELVAPRRLDAARLQALEVKLLLIVCAEHRDDLGIA